jgi:hypothetical protein
MEVGPLITSLIRRCGHLLDSLVGEILGAVVKRLRAAHMPSLIQALLLVLAHVVNQQGGATFIEFLCTCEPDSAALHHVMTLWLEHAPFILRQYHVKVCCAALANLVPARARPHLAESFSSR